MADAAIHQATAANAMSDISDNARQDQTSQLGLRSSATEPVTTWRQASVETSSAKLVPVRQGNASAAQLNTVACARHASARPKRGRGGFGSLIGGRILPSACAGVPVDFTGAALRA